jgi:hypothetical protein
MSIPDLACTHSPVQWITGFFPGSKAAGREPDHSHPSTAEIKNECSHASAPNIGTHGVDGDNFTFFKKLFLICLIMPLQLFRVHRMVG